jgi:hypothetical protein
MSPWPSIAADSVKSTNWRTDGVRGQPCSAGVRLEVSYSRPYLYTLSDEFIRAHGHINREAAG